MNTKTILSQLAGMAQYEMRMHWRGRGMKVLVISLLVMNGLFALVFSSLGDNIVSTFPQLAAMSVNDRATFEVKLNTIMLMWGSWGTMGISMLMIAPIAIADAIPRDRTSRITELMDSLPLSTPTYFSGKVLGTWVSLIIVIAIGMILSVPMWLLLMGPFDPLIYTWMGIGQVILMVMNCGLTVLIASGQPGSIRAMLIAFAVIILLPILMLSFDRGSIIQLASPLRWHIYLYYLYIGYPDIPMAGTIDIDRNLGYVLTVLFGLIELAVVFGIAVWARARTLAQR